MPPSFPYMAWNGSGSRVNIASANGLLTLRPLSKVLYFLHTGKRHTMIRPMNKDDRIDDLRRNITQISLSKKPTLLQKIRMLVCLIWILWPNFDTGFCLKASCAYHLIKTMYCPNVICTDSHYFVFFIL